MRKIDFNQDWIFKSMSIDLTGSIMNGAAAQTEQTVTLPHDAMVLEGRSADSDGAGGYGFYRGGDYEYSKTFHLDEKDAGECFVLEFEGIFGEAVVSVNGNRAGHSRYGYTGFKTDITPFLVWGADNTVVVQVNNSMLPASRWYTGSGITRPVWLYRGGALRVTSDGLKITTPQAAEDVSAVEVKFSLEHDSHLQKTIHVKSTILAPDGSVAVTREISLTLFGNDNPPVTQRLYVRDASLWSCENPALYTLKVELLDGDEIVDCAESTFGIRSIGLDPVHGFTLNGETVKLRGGCIHHDNGIIGAAIIDRAEERRIEILKKSGFNAVRVSHNSTSKALLDACDRHGMLVMEEIYDTWTEGKSKYDSHLHFSDTWEQDLKAMTDKDYNHPCVFMYSIGNEITDLHTSNGRRWSHILEAKVRELDPHRFVTNAINGTMTIMDKLPIVMCDLGFITPEQLASLGQTDGLGINDIMTKLFGAMNDLAVHPSVVSQLEEAYGNIDLIGLNYMRGCYEEYAKTVPDRIVYGSETLPPDIDLNWAKVKKLPQCIGDFDWTAWDYIGETGVGIVSYGDELSFMKGYPSYLAYCGDIDITGHRRPMSYYREIVWGLRKKPYISVQLPEHYGENPMCTPWVTAETVESWTWRGYEGKPCVVEVYSDAPEVELLVNGRSVGRKACGEDARFRAEFDTIYEPGEVCAVAHYDDREETTSLKTAVDAQLVLRADHEVIAPDSLSYVTVEWQDENGMIDTSVDVQVRLEIEGDGSVQGYGSANPTTEENFFEDAHDMYYGRAVAAVRAGHESGEIKVKAYAKTGESSELTIRVE